MADADKPLKNLVATLMFRKKSRKVERPGKPKASGAQDAPTITTSSDVASSTKNEATTAGVPKADTRVEAISPTAGEAVPRFSGDSDRATAPPASVDDKVSLEGWNNDVGAKSPVPSSLARTIPTTAAWSPSVASFNRGYDAAALWDAAYDVLKIRSRPLLGAYERIVDHYLALDDREDQFERRSSTVTNAVTVHSDLFTRRTQMGRVIDIWQREHHDNKIATFNEETPMEESPHSLRDILRASLGRSRYASLPWAAACLAVEGVFCQNSISEANRLGIIEVVSKMEWYIGLSKLLFDPSDGHVDEPTSYTEHLKEMTMGLYKAILLYTIQQSVASSERHRLEPFGSNDSIRQRVFNMEETLVRELRGYAIQSRLSHLLHKVKPTEDTSKTGSGITVEDETRLNGLKTKLQPIKPPSLKAKNGKDDFFQPLYNWASETDEYQSLFHRPPDSLDKNRCRVLWVSGPPGVGKTMLMRATTQGLLEEAEAMSSTEKFNLAYFLCDSRSQPHGYVTQAIKSLIWQMLECQPSLAKHMDDKFQSTGRDTFNDPNDFYAMSTVLYSMLEDPGFGLTYVIVDAIEELCDEDAEVSLHPERTDSALRDLLSLIIKTSQLSPDSPRIKWLVSVDRGKVDATLTPTNGTTQMRLEIDDPRYSQGLQNVAKQYISSKVADVAKASGFRDIFRSQVTSLLSDISPLNFLWVNMACRRIESDGVPWNATSILNKLPKDIPLLYSDMDAMLNKLDSESDQNLCRDILTTTAIAYRSLRKSEVESIVELPANVDLDVVVKKMCFFFLEMYDGSVCYVHPSARDFVRKSLTTDKKVSSKHFLMTQRCLKQAMVRDKSKSKSDTYALTNWMRHLCGVRDKEDINLAIQGVNQFFDDHFLEWAEILATQGLLAEALVLLQKLKISLSETDKFCLTEERGYCLKNIQHALWLLNFHQSNSFLGTLSPKYSLPFLPSKSELRQKLLQKALPWLETAPEMDSGAALAKAIHVLEGHGDWVRCCSYSPDGRLIASGGDDGVVRIWDAETAKVQHTFNFSGYLYRVLLTSDQLLVVVSGSTIGIWDASTGTKFKFPVTGSTDGYFGDIHSSPDGKKLIVAKGQALVVWEVPPDPKADEWTEWTPNLEDNKFYVRSVRFSPDGAMIAYTVDSKIILLDVESRETRRFLEGHTDDIYGLAFRQDSRFLASGSDDRTVRIWDTNTETGGLLCVLNGHGDDVNSVSFSSDGSRLASGSSDSTIRIWKLSTNRPDDKPSYKIQKVLHGHDGIVTALSFAPKGQQLISSSSDNTVRIWDVNTEQEAEMVQEEADHPEQPQQLEGHSTPISFVAFSHKENMFASASSDGQICLWNSDTGKFRGSLKEHEVDIMSLAFSRDGSTLVSASKDRTARVWDTGARLIKHRLRGHSDWVRCAVISPDGNLVASASDDMSVRVWDISSLPRAKAEEDDGGHTEHRRFCGDKAHDEYVYSVTFSPRGGYVASSGDDLKILIWNLRSDGDQQEPESALNNASADSIRGLAFTEDEARIVSCDIGGVVKIWNLQTKACEQILKSEGQFFRTIQFDEHSPNFLITEIGAWPIVINTPPSTLASKSDTHLIPEEVQLIHRASSWYGISNNYEWITWNNKKLIFLPPQYRPSSGYDQVTCCVQDHKVVIGCDSGQILFFKFLKMKSLELSEPNVVMQYPDPDIDRPVRTWSAYWSPEVGGMA